jgi:Alcohol dehydrogenase GroES-like domain
MSIFRGEVPLSPVEYPCILGHEWSGMVAQLGMNVRDPLGTPAIAEGRIPCQRCAAWTVAVGGSVAAMLAYPLPEKAFRTIVAELAERRVPITATPTAEAT